MSNVWPRLRTLSFQLLFGPRFVWTKDDDPEQRAEAKAALHIFASDIAAWQEPSFICGWYPSIRFVKTLLVSWNLISPRLHLSLHLKTVSTTNLLQKVQAMNPKQLHRKILASYFACRLTLCVVNEEISKRVEL